jgi:hypothetical protein
MRDDKSLLVTAITGECEPSDCELQVVRYHLMDNGFRYIERGSDDYEKDEFGFGVVNVALGMEILLKALIVLRGWRQIMRNENGTFDDLRKGELETIGLDEAVCVLKKWRVTSLPIGFRRSLMKISSARNKMVHFYHPGLNIESERRKVATTLARSLHAVICIIESDEYRDDFLSFERKISFVKAKLLNLDVFLNDAEKSIAVRLAPEERERLSRCDACGRQMVNSGTCLLCGIDNPDHHEIKHGAETLTAKYCEDCDEWSMYPIRNEGVARRCNKCGAVEPADDTDDLPDCEMDGRESDV